MHHASIVPLAIPFINKGIQNPHLTTLNILTFSYIGLCLLFTIFLMPISCHLVFLIVLLDHDSLLKFIEGNWSWIVSPFLCHSHCNFLHPLTAGESQFKFVAYCFTSSNEKHAFLPTSLKEFTNLLE